MKKAKIKYYRLILMSLSIGLSLFLTCVIVTIMANIVFCYFRHTGFITEENFRLIYLIDFICLFILIGIIISVISAIWHSKRTDRLSEVLQKVSDGEYSVRLETKKLNDSLSNHIVGMFNDMLLSLESTETLNIDFANAFSHEMKTPAGTINGFAKVLKSNGLTEEEKNEYLDIIIEESERLNALSGNILMLTRLEKQTELTDVTSYNITEQLRQTVAVTYHKWDAKGIDIDFSGEEIDISANRELMAQVWINLLDNAIKFSPENESIYINVIKNADCVSVSIKNYGCTLSQEELSRIFDKFYQGAGDKKALGNGIGLTMVKKIIELHGGSITAKTTDSSAIEFTAILPY